MQPVVDRAGRRCAQRLVIERFDAEDRPDFLVKLMERLQVALPDGKSLSIEIPEFLVTVILQFASQSTDREMGRSGGAPLAARVAGKGPAAVVFLDFKLRRIVAANYDFKACLFELLADVHGILYCWAHMNCPR